LLSPTIVDDFRHADATPPLRRHVAAYDELRHGDMPILRFMTPTRYADATILPPDDAAATDAVD